MNSQRLFFLYYYVTCFLFNTYLFALLLGLFQGLHTPRNKKQHARMEIGNGDREGRWN